MPRFASLKFNRYWVATLPLPAYFGLVTVLYGLLTWAFNAIAHPREATLADLVLRIVFGSLFGAGMTAVIAFQRRRFGGSSLMSATASAMRTGRAPADADRMTWTPVIERRVRVMRRSRWLSPVLMAPIVAFGVVTWILVPHAVVPALWLISVALIVVALAEIQTARFMPRAMAVLDQLRSELPAPVAFATSTPDEVQRPGTMLAALIACWAAAVGAAFSLGRFLLTPGDVTDAARSVSATGNISLARAEQLAGIAAAVLTTYWSVLLVALLLLGWFAFRGRNWARALLVPTALLTLIELVAHKPISIFITIATITAVVLLYLPASTAFVAARKTHRRAA